MKLSFSTNAFVRFSVAEAIEIIAKTGYSGVEILADVPHLYPYSTTGPELDEVAASLKKNRIEAANINANTAVGYYGAKFWEPLFEPSLANPESGRSKVAGRVHQKVHRHCRLSLLPERERDFREDGPGVKPEKSLALLKESILEIVEYAAARHVRVGMEYEPGLLVERAEELAVLIREVGAENFGANLDFGHSHLAGEAPVDVAQSLASSIFHIHLEDIGGRKHYHLIPGEGDIDFEDIARALAGIEYEGFGTVELYTFPENPEQAARKAFDYLRDKFQNRIVK